MLLGPEQGFTLTALILVNVANVVVILMLLFLAYPLSFFGSDVPDRVVKTELLRFILRGPATALLALVAIIYTDPCDRRTGPPRANLHAIRGGRRSPGLAVDDRVKLAARLEKRLIYSDEDDDQINKLQNLSDQLLTQTDLVQLLEAILAASCDYLRVSTAFILCPTWILPRNS